jgi:hypothetical protein
MSNNNNESYDTIPSPTNIEDSDTLNTDINNTKGNNKMNNPKIKKIEWSPENELIMVEWCDVAQCYKWLNSRSHAKYAYLHAWFTIPAIIFSTISGTASFAQESFPESIKAYAPSVIGSINITIGILTTIQQYLKISELNEAHRVSSIAWDKFARNIRIELSKRPSERSEAGGFIKHCRLEFDRLMETSPDIIDKVVKDFKKKFSGQDGTEKRKRYDQLKKPDICDTLISANETRHKWYLDIDNDVIEMNDDLTDGVMQQKNKLIQDQQKLLEEKEKEITTKNDFEKQSVRLQIETMKTNQEKQVEQDKYINEQVNHIEIYVKNFVEVYQRKPLREEITDNLSTQVPQNILDIFFASYNTTDNV